MTDLHVHRFGTAGAAPLVLVHGLTESGGGWPDAVERWGSAWDIRAVDLRGHGLSPRFDDNRLAGTPDVLVQDLVAVLEEIGRPVVLVGHSMGGVTSLRVGVARPDLVRAMVLEDPAQPTNEWRPDPAFSQSHLDHVEQVIADVEAEIARMERESGWTRTEIRGWAAAKPLVDRRFLREGLFLGAGEWEPLFNRLGVPTLVVGPVGGHMLPRRDLLTNPLVELVEVPGCGHQVRRDNPEGYHAVVDPFLARHSGPRLQLTSVTIGADDATAVAAFWSRLLGFPLSASEPDWAQLRAWSQHGRITINVERDEHHVAPVWPSEAGRPIQQEHLDILVDDLEGATAWALECGARLADTQPQDGIRVMLDPAGHPFCLFVPGC